MREQKVGEEKDAHIPSQEIITCLPVKLLLIFQWYKLKVNLCT